MRKSNGSEELAEFVKLRAELEFEKGKIFSCQENKLKIMGENTWENYWYRSSRRRTLADFVLRVRPPWHLGLFFFSIIQLKFKSHLNFLDPFGMCWVPNRFLPRVPDFLDRLEWPSDPAVAISRRPKWLHETEKHFFHLLLFFYLTVSISLMPCCLFFYSHFKLYRRSFILFLLLLLPTPLFILLSRSNAAPLASIFFLLTYFPI